MIAGGGVPPLIALGGLVGARRARGGGSRRASGSSAGRWVWTIAIAVRARLQRAHRGRHRRLPRRRRAVPDLADRRQGVQPARRARLAADVPARVPDARRGLGAQRRPDLRPVLPRLRDLVDVGADAVPPAPRDGGQPARQARRRPRERSASRSGASSTRGASSAAGSSSAPALLSFGVFLGRGDRVPRDPARRHRLLPQEPRRADARRLLRRREARRPRRDQERRDGRDARRDRSDVTAAATRRRSTGAASRSTTTRTASGRGRSDAPRHAADARASSPTRERRVPAVGRPGAAGAEIDALGGRLRQAGDLARSARLRRAVRRERRRGSSSTRTRCASASRAVERNDEIRLEHGSTLHYTVWSELAAAAGRRAARGERRRCRAGYERRTSQLPPEITPRTRELARADHRGPDEQLRQGGRDRALADDEPDVHARARGSGRAGAGRLLPVRSQEGPLRVLRVGVRDPRARGRRSRRARSTASSAASGTSTRATSRCAPATRTRGTRCTSRRRRGWVTFDPTPPAQRRRARPRRHRLAREARPVPRHAAVPVDEVGDRVRPRVAARAVQGDRRRDQGRARSR